MSAVVVDTHAIVWYLTADSRISLAASRALDDATSAGDYIYVSSICLIKLTYLAGKGEFQPVPEYV